MNSNVKCKCIYQMYNILISYSMEFYIVVKFIESGYDYKGIK